MTDATPSESSRQVRDAGNRPFRFLNANTTFFWPVKMISLRIIFSSIWLTGIHAMVYRSSLILLCLAGCATTAPTSTEPATALANQATNLLAGEWKCKLSESTRTKDSLAIIINFTWTEILESKGQFRLSGEGHIINVFNDGNFEEGKFNMVGVGEWSATSKQFSQQHSSLTFDALNENELSKLMESERFKFAFPIDTDTTYRIDGNEWVRSGTRKDIRCRKSR